MQGFDPTCSRDPSSYPPDLLIHLQNHTKDVQILLDSEGAFQGTMAVGETYYKLVQLLQSTFQQLA